MVADFREKLIIEYNKTNDFNIYWHMQDLAVEDLEESIIDLYMKENLDADEVREFLEVHCYDIPHIFFLLIFNNRISIIDEY